VRLTPMNVFYFDSAAADMRERAETWSQPLRVPAMSVGVYLLSAGSKDEHTPHHEDEVYDVVRGRAVLRIGSSTRAVGPATAFSSPREIPTILKTSGMISSSS
jgi:mannose-6-phosphate isomerase-like protein (cupin superfamily)